MLADPPHVFVTKAGAVAAKQLHAFYRPTRSMRMPRYRYEIGGGDGADPFAVIQNHLTASPERQSFHVDRLPL